jgi:hypothetical protein
MSTAVTYPGVRRDMAAQAANQALPTWHRIGCLARAGTNHHGHARFATGQLRRQLHLTAQQTSEALAVAKARGWVDSTSTARCVVLPGHALNPCEENHR